MGDNNRKRVRNSNVEALRLMAMLLVVFNHFLWNVDAILDGSQGVDRYALLNALGILQNFGGVGDDLFFGISAWFLCAENISLKRDLKRAWVLERQLLFYSIVLFVISTGIWLRFGIGDFSWKTVAVDGVTSLFPIVTIRWWYPTSYVVFLLFHSWVDSALRAFGRRTHRNLAVAMIIAWGIVPYYDIVGYSPLLFLYLYTVVSYVRWYMVDRISSPSATTRMIVIGLLLGIVSNSVAQFLSPNAPVLAVWMNKPRCIPSLLISLGLLVKATQAKPRYSRVVNMFAGSTLAVYLMIGSMLSRYAAMACDALGASGWMRYGEEFAVAVAFFCGGILIDLARRGLFAVTVDRRPGMWFEKVWTTVVQRDIFEACVRRVDAALTGTSTKNHFKKG